MKGQGADDVGEFATLRLLADVTGNLSSWWLRARQTFADGCQVLTDCC